MTSTCPHGSLAEKALRPVAAECQVGDGVLRHSAQPRGGARRAGRVLVDQLPERSDELGHPMGFERLIAYEDRQQSLDQAERREMSGTLANDHRRNGNTRIRRAGHQ